MIEVIVGIAFRLARAFGHGWATHVEAAGTMPTAPTLKAWVAKIWTLCDNAERGWEPWRCGQRPRYDAGTLVHSSATGRVLWRISMNLHNETILEVSFTRPVLGKVATFKAMWGPSGEYSHTHIHVREKGYGVRHLRPVAVVLAAAINKPEVTVDSLLGDFRKIPAVMDGLDYKMVLQDEADHGPDGGPFAERLRFLQEVMAPQPPPLRDRRPVPVIKPGDEYEIPLAARKMWA